MVSRVFPQDRARIAISGALVPKAFELPQQVALPSLLPGAELETGPEGHLCLQGGLSWSGCLLCLRGSGLKKAPEYLVPSEVYTFSARGKTWWAQCQACPLPVYRAQVAPLPSEV